MYLYFVGNALDMQSHVVNSNKFKLPSVGRKLKADSILSYPLPDVVG